MCLSSASTQVYILRRKLVVLVVGVVMGLEVLGLFKHGALLLEVRVELVYLEV